MDDVDAAMERGERVKGRVGGVGEHVGWCEEGAFEGQCVLEEFVAQGDEFGA